jgi:serine/threonine-protein kinase HipA
MADLVVELYGTRAGVLAGTWRTFDFLPDPAAVARFGIDSPILSVAIPLTVVAVRSRKERRQNFFRELLPEGRMLARLAQQAGLAEQDVIGLLRAYGRDVAGALQIWDPDVPGEPKQPALEPLSRCRGRRLARARSGQPARKQALRRQDLTGRSPGQDRARSNRGGWNRVIDGWPSTHILKPAVAGLPDLDLRRGVRLALRPGRRAHLLPDVDRGVPGVPAVVIERYDRSPDAPQGRIHQEDFNQVLGAAGNQKYQKYGGKVSLERIARVFSAASETATR